MGHISLLPPEILAVIFQPMHFDDEDSPSRFEAIQVCSVCKAWLVYGRTLLYRSLEFQLSTDTTAHLDPVVTSLATFPYLVNFVRTLQIGVNDTNNDTYAPHGAWEALEAPSDDIPERLRLDTVLKILGRCESLKEVEILGYLSDAAVLAIIMEALPKSVGSINIAFSGVVRLGSALWECPIRIETRKLLTLLRNQGSHLKSLSLEFGSSCLINDNIEPTFAPVTIENLTVATFNKSGNTDGDDTMNDIGGLCFFKFVNPSTLHTLSLPMTPPFIDHLVSVRNSLPHLTTLEFSQHSSRPSPTTLANTLSILLPHLKLQSISIQQMKHAFPLSSDVLTLLMSLPPTLLSLRLLDARRHSEVVTTFWMKGKCSRIRRIEMWSLANIQYGACRLEKACCAEVCSIDEGHLGLGGVIDAVPLLQGQ